MAERETKRETGGAVDGLRCLVGAHQWREYGRTPVAPGLIGATCYYTCDERCAACGRERTVGVRVVYEEPIAPDVVAAIDAALHDARERAERLTAELRAAQLARLAAERARRDAIADDDTQPLAITSPVFVAEA